VGETIAETRLEIAAQRADLERTIGELRAALDLRQRVAERPALVIGLGAAAAFLLVGGPRRVARLARRTLRPGAEEAAFAALPDALRAWVEAMANGRASARDRLVQDLEAWHRAPMRSKKVRKELAKEMVEGPPGPNRAAWLALETALGILSAALAKRAVERFLTADGPAPKPEPVPAPPSATAPQSDHRNGGRSSYAGRGPAGGATRPD